ncbi:MAG TPA: SO_0444 family Cu/Zn efflux transporter [Methanosarcina sp.]|nr:SO_0444 family Cu/Zn efflux transporter [Methanosarcina sp.]
MNFETFSVLLSLFSGILLASWKIFVEAAPYLIFGLGVAGVLNVVISDKKIMDYLGTHAGKIRSVVNASLAGLPLPLCSCGVVPAAMSIRRRGANRGATLSFLISTPETGVDSIAITYALLDPLMTIFRPLAALATAVLAGLADNFLIGEDSEKRGTKKQGKKAGVLAFSTLIGASVQGNQFNRFSCGCSKSIDPESAKPGTSDIVEKKTELKLTEIKPLKIKSKSEDGISSKEVNKLSLKNSVQQTDFSACSCESGACKAQKSETSEKNKDSIKNQFFRGMKYAYIELPGELSKWMLVGIVLAGIISYAIPENFIQNYLGGGIESMLVMLLVGIPLYICATASTPLAASLIAKGMSPGTAFVFLLAGPATNAATITMVARFLGKRSAVLYLSVISLCALGAGLLLDWFYLNLGINATATLGTAKELLPEDLKIGFAILLLLLMVYGAFVREKGCGCSEFH